MKTIAPAAMDAIAAGEAIVTGAVEIVPREGRIPDIIETGTAVELVWQQSTFEQVTNDQARMGLAYLDQSSVQIGSINWASLTNTTAGVWTERSLSDTTPADCAFIRVLMEMNRRTGTNNDGYIDDIELSVGGSTIILRNPSAEQGVAHWTNETGAIGFSNTNVTPHDGAYYFTGGVVALSRAHQDYATFSATEGDTIRVWGGYGPIDIDGDTYQPLGDRAFAQQTANALGGVANGLTLGLSGIEPAALELLDADEIKGASVVIHRLIFASDGKTLLGSEVWDRGRVDTVDTDETVGGSAAINLAVESAARGLGHSGARQRADSDQRLINPNDGYFKSTAYAGEKELYWGGKRPVRTGDAHGGVVAGTAGGTGTRAV